MMKFFETPTAYVIEHRGQYIRIKKDEFNLIKAALLSAIDKPAAIATDSRFPAQSITISAAERRYGVPGITIRGWLNTGKVSGTPDRPMRVMVESMSAAATEYYNKLTKVKS